LKRSGVLAERDFRLLLGAWGLSALGDFLAVTALTLRVQEQSGSGFAVAALLFAAALPQVVFNPVAGWLVDRFETRHVLAVAALAQAFVVAGLAAWDGLAITYALVFVLNCGLAVERPALFTVIPRIVGEGQAPAAYGWFESVKYATVTLGLLLGGVLTGAFGPATALLVDAATFLVTAGVALALHTRRAAPTGALVAREGMTAGLRLIGRDRLLRTLVLVLAGSILFGGIDNVANVFFAKDALGIGDAGYGALAAAWGVGMIAGAVVAGRRVRAANAAVVVIAAVAVMGGAILATAPAPVVWTALATLAIGGVGNGLSNVAMRVLLQSRVDEALRGRVYAAYQGALSVADFTALAIGGALIQLLGARWTLALAGGGCLLVGLYGLPVVRRARIRTA
jgi:MFS family permease